MALRPDMWGPRSECWVANIPDCRPKREGSEGVRQRARARGREVGVSQTEEAGAVIAVLL